MYKPRRSSTLNPDAAHNPPSVPKPLRRVTTVSKTALDFMKKMHKRRSFVNEYSALTASIASKTEGSEHKRCFEGIRDYYLSDRPKYNKDQVVLRYLADNSHLFNGPDVESSLVLATKLLVKLPTLSEGILNIISDERIRQLHTIRHADNTLLKIAVEGSVVASINAFKRTYRFDRSLAMKMQHNDVPLLTAIGVESYDKLYDILLTMTAEDVMQLLLPVTINNTEVTPVELMLNKNVRSGLLVIETAYANNPEATMRMQCSSGNYITNAYEQHRLFIEAIFKRQAHETLKALQSTGLINYFATKDRNLLVELITISIRNGMSTNQLLNVLKATTENSSTLGYNIGLNTTYLSAITAVMRQFYAPYDITRVLSEPLSQDGNSMLSNIVHDHNLVRAILPPESTNRACFIPYLRAVRRQVDGIQGVVAGIYFRNIENLRLVNDLVRSAGTESQWLAKLICMEVYMLRQKTAVFAHVIAKDAFLARDIINTLRDARLYAEIEQAIKVLPLHTLHLQQFDTDAVKQAKLDIVSVNMFAISEIARAQVVDPAGSTVPSSASVDSDATVPSLKRLHSPQLGYAGEKRRPTT